MCLYIKSGPHVATEDLKVYKALKVSQTNKGISLRSPCRNAEYNFGRIRRVKSLKPVGGRYMGDEAVHAGLHACTTISAAFQLSFHVFEAVIPKGSTYYIGVDSDIVSTALYIPINGKVRYQKRVHNLADFISKILKKLTKYEV